MYPNKIYNQESIEMQNENESQVRSELCSKIQALEEIYQTLRNYLSGAQYDSLEMIGNLKVFKDSLDRISALILTFYTLRGQRTKITWEQLLNNISNAIETILKNRSTDPKIAIQAALSMSEPNGEQVMQYLASLKNSLQ